jgi:hypothetical protein
MKELIRYLEVHDFKVFIASAGGMSFMRPVVEEIYGISRERVIGSNITFEIRMTEDGPELYRKPGLIAPVDDGPGKPVNIELHIGRKPILAGVIRMGIKTCYGTVKQPCIGRCNCC